MKIGVFGSAAGNIEEVKEKARELGVVIAKRGHVLITGGTTGLPYEASLAAFNAGGETIGYSPAFNREDHVRRFEFPTEGFTTLKYIPSDFPFADQKGPSLKYRNVVSVSDCDAAVFISGRMGTLNEFTIAYDIGRNMGLMAGTGGITDHIPELLRHINKPAGGILVIEGDPKTLVEKLEAFP